MALPKDELAELYLNQWLSLYEIGQRVGASSLAGRVLVPKHVRTVRCRQE